MKKWKRKAANYIETIKEVKMNEENDIFIKKIFWLMLSCFCLKERADASGIDINHWKDRSAVDVKFEAEENG